VHLWFGMDNYNAVWWEHFISIPKSSKVSNATALYISLSAEQAKS